MSIVDDFVEVMIDVNNEWGYLLDDINRIIKENNSLKSENESLRKKIIGLENEIIDLK
jgi:regulator of replication initiation timing